MPAKATLVVGVLLAMLVPAAADASPPGPPRISWAACGPRLECATVRCRWTGGIPVGRASTWR
jgi:hypothetical protein